MKESTKPNHVAIFIVSEIPNIIQIIALPLLLAGNNSNQLYFGALYIFMSFVLSLHVNYKAINYFEDQKLSKQQQSRFVTILIVTIEVICAISYFLFYLQRSDFDAYFAIKLFLLTVVILIPTIFIEIRKTGNNKN